MTTSCSAYYQSASTTFSNDTHGILGGVSSAAQGEKFWQGFASGAAASLVSGTVAGVCGLPQLQVPEVWVKTAMIAAGGLAGGVSSSIAGGEFIDGLCNGLICAGLNHVLHWVASNTLGPDDPPSSTVKKITRQKVTENIAKYEILNYILGKKIASYTGSEFNERMFMNYWEGAGDYTLTEAEFNDIVENAVSIGDPQIIMQDGQKLSSQLVSLYGTPYDRSLGRSTLYLDKAGNPIGFYDDYDFNIRNANRPINAQIQTIMVKYASYLNIHSKPFKIKYP